MTEFKKSTLDYEKGFFKKKELTQECFLPVSNFTGTGFKTSQNSSFEVQTPCRISPDSIEPLNPDAKIVMDEQPTEAHENGKRQQK